MSSVPTGPLQNRIALVTRGESEQGRAIADALAQAGARVVALNDTADGASPAEAVERAITPFGRLDILVNPHVISPAAPAETMPLARFKQDIASNLGAVFFWCQAAAAQMHRQTPRGGCIINISSVGGVLALPGQAGFCAAMAGLDALTKILATEWQSYGIRVVNVGAGLSRELADEQTLHTVLPDGTTAGHRHVAEYVLTAATDLGQVAAYLASDAARHINGTTVYADGGWLADGYWE
jgi:NAD(P)-dependent dehydrogenase (short-subunit alcohol dehydrogenase family)